MTNPRQMLPWVLAVVAGAALLLSATTGLGADGKSSLATRVAAKRGGFGATDVVVAKKKKAKKPGGVKVTYLSGPIHTIAAGAFDAARIDCPAKDGHATGGYFNTDSPQVVLSGSVPVGQGWGISVTNLSNAVQHFQRGVVCVR